MFEKQRLRLLETNIDDMNPEVFPYVSDKLFAAGARDVWVTPIVMKQGRPAHCLSVLIEEEKQQLMLEILFSETSTIGARISDVERFELERRIEMVGTCFGEIPLKLAFDSNGRLLNASPEYSKCREIALRLDVPLKTVFCAALEAWERKQASTMKI